MMRKWGMGRGKGGKEKREERKREKEGEQVIEGKREGRKRG